MAVPVSQRQQSNSEFLHNGMKLRQEVLRRVRKLPASWQYYLARPMADHSSEMMLHIRLGNSIYPTNPTELDRRILEFKLAKGYCEALCQDIEDIRALVHVTGEGTLKEIRDLDRKAREMEEEARQLGEKALQGNPDGAAQARKRELLDQAAVFRDRAASMRGGITITYDQIGELCRLIDLEEKLLSGLINSDRKRTWKGKGSESSP